MTLQGHAIQCRINAEDPRNNFMPCTGTVTAYLSPGGIGVRIDGAVYCTAITRFPPTTTHCLAKLTVRGRTWEEAVSRMRRSLEEHVLRGVKTTIPFMKNVMMEQDFQAGRFDTSYLDTHPDLYQYEESGSLRTWCWRSLQQSPPTKDSDLPATRQHHLNPSYARRFRRPRPSAWQTKDQKPPQEKPREKNASEAQPKAPPARSPVARRIRNCT